MPFSFKVPSVSISFQFFWEYIPPSIEFLHRLFDLWHFKEDSALMKNWKKSAWFVRVKELKDSVIVLRIFFTFLVFNAINSFRNAVVSRIAPIRVRDSAVVPFEQLFTIIRVSFISSLCQILQIIETYRKYFYWAYFFLVLHQSKSLELTLQIQSIYLKLWHRVQREK